MVDIDMSQQACVKEDQVSSLLIHPDGCKKNCNVDQIKSYRMWLACTLANLGYFIFGMCMAWPSPLMPRLRDHTADSPLAESVTKYEEGWIGSLIALGASIGCPVAGPMCNRIGRKLTLLSSSLIFAASFIVLILGNDIWSIYLARMLQGIAGGFVVTTLPIYFAETSTDNLRGALGCLITILLTCGILFTYCIGPYVSYLTFQWCCLPIPAVYFLSFIFIPETPFFFALKNRTKDGIKSLQFLRGQSTKPTEEEMARIHKAVDADMMNKGGFADIFKSRAYKKAFFISTGLHTFKKLSGVAAVTFNTQTIFTSANSTIDPPIAAIILGVTQLIANLITPLVIDRAGRKLILLISAAGMCLALVTLGTFFYVQEFGDASNILWIPIPCLMIFYAMFSVGFNPIPNVIMGEILPSNIKSTVSSTATTLNWATTFLVTRWYPELDALGSYIAFWMFGGFCVLAFVFVFLYVIETKGLSLQDIQQKLRKG